MSCEFLSPLASINGYGFLTLSTKRPLRFHKNLSEKARSLTKNLTFLPRGRENIESILICIHWKHNCSSKKNLQKYGFEVQSNLSDSNFKGMTVLCELSRVLIKKFLK